MAIPFDDAQTWLTYQSAMIRQIYHPKYIQQVNRFGSRTNRLFNASKRTIEGDGVNVQVQDRRLYGARFQADRNADFGRARTFGSATYKVTMSDTPTASDFRRLGLPLQVSHDDVNRLYKDEVSSDNYITRLTKEAMENLTETMALHQHLDRTALLGTVSGTPRMNDNRLFASCSALAATGGARIVLTGGSLAAVPPNLELDIFPSGSSVKRFSVIVTDYNPRDNSVGLYGAGADGQVDTSISLAALASTDELYISGERNAGPILISDWFREPTTGDSFYGKDRTSPLNRWMLPHKSGPTTNTLFTRTFLDNAMTEMGYITEDPEGGYQCITTMELEQRYRQEIGNDVLVQYPTAEQQGKLVASYGFDAALYRHPTAGRIVLTPDAFAPPNKIRFLRIGDWEMQYYGSNTFEWLPGWVGNWSRMQSSTPGGGYTTTYRMEGMLSLAGICTFPRRQLEIGNVTAA